MSGGPLIDPSDILLDPDFCSLVSVIQRPEVVTDKGVSTTPANMRTDDVPGVITASSPTDRERLDDMDRTRRVMSFVTQFMLRATTPGYKPDQILWQGNSYEVLNVQPYPEYGAGWIQALVGSIDRQDQPSVPQMASV